MSAVADAKRLVVKVGTSTLTYENGRLNLRRIESLVKVLSDLKNAGREIVLVTSGAIGVGAGHLGLKERPRDIGGKQAAAAVGQCELMYTYDKQFSEYGHVTAQVLLTRDVVEDDRRKSNVVNTLCWNTAPCPSSMKTTPSPPRKSSSATTIPSPPWWPSWWGPMPWCC